VKHWAREYRYVIAIGIIFFIAFCLAVVAQFFKATNCVAKWAFTFFSEWAMVLSAAVMLLLAAAAFWAIMDYRHGRRVDRKQRLQNAIVNWAVDVRKALFVPWFNRDQVIKVNMREKLEAIAAISSIVKANASELSGDGNLVRKVGNAATHLKQFIDNLQYTEPENFSTLETPWKNLKQEFLNVIESASSIGIPEFK